MILVLWVARGRDHFERVFYDVCFGNVLLSIFSVDFLRIYGEKSRKRKKAASASQKSGTLNHVRIFGAKQDSEFGLKPEW